MCATAKLVQIVLFRRGKSTWNKSYNRKTVNSNLLTKTSHSMCKYRLLKLHITDCSVASGTWGGI